MTTRDDLLNDVKRALAAGVGPAPVSATAGELDAIRAEIERGREAAGPRAAEASLERFLTELGRLDADAITIGTEGAAAESIARALRAAGVERVAIQPHPELGAVSAALATDGRTVASLDGKSRQARRAVLAEVDVVVSAADFGLAATGTLVFTPDTLPDRLAAGLAPWHIAVVRSSRIVRDLAALLEASPSVASRSLLLVTGPSRTADIEKQIVLGAHGPRRLTVVVVGED